MLLSLDKTNNIDDQSTARGKLVHKKIWWIYTHFITKGQYVILLINGNNGVCALYIFIVSLTDTPRRVLIQKEKKLRVKEELS